MIGIIIASAAAGAVAAIWVRPALDFAAARIRGRHAAKALTDNKVSTISQILHLAIQGSPAGVTVVTKTGDVVLSNSRAHDMGIVHERAVTDTVWQQVQAVFDDKEPRTIDLAGPAGRPGSRITAVRANIKPLTLVDLRFVLIYSSDESENVRMEAARRDFVANVSHELKTPVGGMALLAEALVESADDPEHVTYFGNRLTTEARRLGEMITELISLSKLQGAEALPDMQPVTIDRVIDEAITRNQVTADSAGITLTRDDTTGVIVHGDEQLLITAVSNLISNAVNYSPAGTTVSITQAVTGPGSGLYPVLGTPPETATGAAPVVPVGSSAGTVLIRVTDRGIGIAPDDQQRVFERFFRVDKARSRSTGGTGLGLAIVKHVAANHGGTISLWSRPGTGSTFTLELPLASPEDDRPPDDLPAPDDNPVASTTPHLRRRHQEKG